MKRLLPVFIFAGLLLSLSGCTFSETVRQLASAADTPTQTPVPDHARVYMDEVQGILTDFTGNRLTLTKDSDVYSFDISQAGLECKNGMIAGDEISVIYEGQLENTDTSSVKVLKVVNTLQDSAGPEEKTASGQITGLTANSLTIKTGEGQTVIFPSVGAGQYYQNGLKAGAQVYIHYIGNLVSAGDAVTLSGAHVKTISISDIDPPEVPAPTPTPTPVPEGQDAAEVKKEEHFRGVIQDIQLNVLEITAENTENRLKLDMSAIPCYFSGGTSVGSHVNVIYTGTFNGTTAEGITLLGITGETPENLRQRGISFTVSGEITGSTANTITLQTADGIPVTCYTENADDSSSGGLLSGSSVKITFNPADSRDSNIYTALKIEDA